MTLIVIARFFFVKIKITLVGSPKKRPAITKKNLAITKIFDFRAVFWHITWISTSRAIFEISSPCFLRYKKRGKWARSFDQHPASTHQPAYLEPSALGAKGLSQGPEGII